MLHEVVDEVCGLHQSASVDAVQEVRRRQVEFFVHVAAYQRLSAVVALCRRDS